jgi:hypothetical protein
MQKSPPPFIWACPEEKNILDCMSGPGSVLELCPCSQRVWDSRLTRNYRAFHHCASGLHHVCRVMHPAGSHTRRSADRLIHLMPAGSTMA